MTSRRFPPPWTIIEHAESDWVQDATGQAVGWFYFRHDPEVARHAGVLSRDEARRMAVNFALMTELLEKASRWALRCSGRAPIFRRAVIAIDKLYSKE
jgi:hypothetical protein